MQSHIIEQTNKDVTTVRFADAAYDFEQWLLLRSDAHHDSPNCRRDVEKEHLDKAVERNALIFDGGDLLDAMQGQYGPRRTYDDIRPEDVGIDYYDRIVDHAIEFYAPYAKNFAVFGKGNHESAVMKHCNHDITTALVRGLRGHGCKGIIGDYGGWIRLLFTINKTKRASVLIYRNHGAGSDAPVTMGVIQTNRQQVYLPDADVIWNGHNHNAYALAKTRLRLSEKGMPYQDVCWHIRTPGYKDEFANGMKGWAVERGMPPKPIGACWVHLTVRTYNRTPKIFIESILDVV